MLDTASAVAGLPDATAAELKAVLDELQAVVGGVGSEGLKVSVATGAAAVTNITVTGIATTDELKSVVMYATGVPSDVTSDASITSAGHIQLATTNSTGNKLVVTWLDLTP